ncbi:hypothetical protein SISNIDRAFT_451189 [Sistotremastrum niveocremeum HHB9708]|uniref:ABM domain-containing protein n=2 Tax=Sistotremastraceae TaxID=3402574 RepID=A0A164Y000_9AGAM|nr:hypothetical protein SISNIDRAFT_451189 [Sistotremastrum niveocremeum HHB9708]KZT38223.1 hypothetical protein SISSUDRAFT_1047317 [Sistotremastrum suecicum HHB10207 ss-3]
MSSDPSKITDGHIILVATLDAVPGQETELANLLKAVVAVATSDQEPGCLTYRVVQYETKFVVFEEYVDTAAVKQHFVSDAFKAFAASHPTTLVGGKPGFGFYKELTPA